RSEPPARCRTSTRVMPPFSSVSTTQRWTGFSSRAMPRTTMTTSRTIAVMMARARGIASARMTPLLRRHGDAPGVARGVDRDALRQGLQLVDLRAGRALGVAVLAGLVRRRLGPRLGDLCLRLADLGERRLCLVDRLLHVVRQGHAYEVEAHV